MVIFRAPQLKKGRSANIDMESEVITEDLLDAEQAKVNKEWRKNCNEWSSYLTEGVSQRKAVI